MSVERPFIDTSALAKWYLPEPFSSEFRDFILTADTARISRLVALELRCLLRRRCRSGDITKDFELLAFSTFERDVINGHIVVHPLSDLHAVAARELIEALPDHPLRTLDALHLATVVDAGKPLLATADRVMAGAARALGVEVVLFA